MEESPYPFVGTEALAAGYVTRRTLRRQFRPVHRNVFVPTTTSSLLPVAQWLPRCGLDGRQRSPARR